MALRREALLDSPLSFASSPEDDVMASIEETRRRLQERDHSAVFGAFAPQLAAMVGVYRDRQRKAAHKAHIWGMYVQPHLRGSGIAGELLEAAVTRARTFGGVEWVHLSVSETAPGAKRLYERAGFTVWGTEPEALRHDGGVVAEHHMAMRLAT